MTPSFFTQALTGGSAPLNAGRCLLLVDIISALTAPDLEFIRKYLNISATVGTLIERHSQVFAILPRTFTIHNITQPYLFWKLHFTTIVEQNYTALYDFGHAKLL